MLKISIINFWKDADNDMFFIEFIRRNIDENIKIVHYTEHPDILLSSVFGNIYHISRIQARVKIMFLGENLSRGPYIKWKKLLNQFDFVVGFHPTKLERKKIRFPLWLIYYPFYKWDDSNNILNFIEKENETNRQYKKLFLSTCIARHDRGGQRSFICDIFEKYKPGQLKYPSSFRKNINSIQSGKKSKINFLKQCIFNVCPENSIGESYHTEKIIQAFEGGTIPVYWAVDKPEKELIHEHKYIFCHLNSTDDKKIQYGIDCYRDFYKGPIFTENGPYIIDHYYETLLFQIQVKLQKISKPKIIALSTSMLLSQKIFNNVKLLSQQQTETEQIKKEYKYLNNNDILVIVTDNVPKNIENLIFEINNNWKGMTEQDNCKLFRKCKYVDYYLAL